MWPLSKSKKTKQKAQKKAPQKTAKRGAKQAQSLKRRRQFNLMVRGVSLGLGCLVVILSLYVWKSGLLEEWVQEAQYTVDREIASAGFLVGEVRITGQNHTSLKQIRAALALYDGQSIVSLDLENMLTRVEDLPWVKKASISRMMPDALNVIITEHDAAGRWQNQGQILLITKTGHVITDKGLGAFSHLPHVVGPGANEKLPELLAMQSQYPDLFARVKSASWVGERRWDLIFNNGIKIKLPEKGSDLAWEQLYQYESKQEILAKEVLIVDLRLYGKTVIRLTPEEAERRRKIAKTGKKEESI